jgi:hypothetical protein
LLLLHPCTAPLHRLQMTGAACLPAYFTDRTLRLSAGSWWRSASCRRSRPRCCRPAAGATTWLRHPACWRPSCSYLALTACPAHQQVDSLFLQTMDSSNRFCRVPHTAAQHGARKAALDASCAGSAAAPSGSLDPTAIVDRVLAGGTAEASNTSLEAQADLLAACLAHQADPAAACGAALLRLAGVEPAVAGAVNCFTVSCNCNLCCC